MTNLRKKYSFLLYTCNEQQTCHYTDQSNRLRAVTESIQGRGRTDRVSAGRHKSDKHQAVTSQCDARAVRNQEHARTPRTVPSYWHTRVSAKGNAGITRPSPTSQPAPERDLHHWHQSMAERKAPLPILHRAGVCGAALLLLLTPLATRPSEPCGPRISASRHHGIPSTTGNSSMATSVRKVLLAVDGSDNAEYAFDCKLLSHFLVVLVLSNGVWPLVISSGCFKVFGNF